MRSDSAKEKGVLVQHPFHMAQRQFVTKLQQQTQQYGNNL